MLPQEKPGEMARREAQKSWDEIVGVLREGEAKDLYSEIAVVVRLEGELPEGGRRFRGKHWDTVDEALADIEANKGEYTVIGNLHAFLKPEHDTENSDSPYSNRNEFMRDLDVLNNQT